MLKINKQLHSKHITLLSLLVFIFSPQKAYSGAPDFPPPPKAAVEWVGQDVEVNGVKSSIRAFHTRESIENVVAFYRKEWARPVDDRPGFMETIDAAPWYIISRVEDNYLLTVQVQVNQKDPSSSWGYLSISPLPNTKKAKVPELGNTIPKISGSQVMSEMKSDDPGKKGTTVLISNTHSVRNNADFYRSHYLNKGWTTETDSHLGNIEGHSLVFKTRRERITIMLLKDKDYTRIVVNSVKNSVF